MSTISVSIISLTPSCSSRRHSTTITLAQAYKVTCHSVPAHPAPQFHHKAGLLEDMVDTPRSSRRRRWDGSIQSTPNAHGLTSSRQQQVEYPPRRDSTAGSSSRSRRNSRRGRGQTSVVIGLAAAASLGRTRAQYVDGGSVSMDCEVCYCDGSTDDGTVEVFDNPSSGQRVRRISKSE